MTMIQITEEKKEKMSELCEKMLRIGGKLMQCLENMEDSSEMGMREPYEDDEYDDSRHDRMGMRRGRDSRGRYTRY